MVKNKGKVEFCSVCGEGEIRRDLGSFDPANESHGRSEKCSSCHILLWVPGDPGKPIEPFIDTADYVLLDMLLGQTLAETTF